MRSKLSRPGMYCTTSTRSRSGANQGTCATDWGLRIMPVFERNMKLCRATYFYVWVAYKKDSDKKPFCSFLLSILFLWHRPWTQTTTAAICHHRCHCHRHCCCPCCCHRHLLLNNSANWPPHQFLHCVRLIFQSQSYKFSTPTFPLTKKGPKNDSVYDLGEHNIPQNNVHLGNTTMVILSKTTPGFKNHSLN